MALAEIADGITVTAEQQDRGIATVDDTDVALLDRLHEHADALPCSAATAATVVEVYAAGESVETAAAAGDTVPMTAAKTLYRCGFRRVHPLAADRREPVRGWIEGRRSREAVLASTAITEREFAFAAYAETHDPIPAVAETVTSTVLDPTGADCTVDSAVEVPDRLR